MKKLWVWIVASLIVVALIVGVVVKLMPYYRPTTNYWVVYLQSGEFYVGHLTRLPKLTMTDGYLVSLVKDVKDPAKDTYKLFPMNQMMWSPKQLYLNPDHMYFYGPLEDKSDIAQSLLKAGK